MPKIHDTVFLNVPSLGVVPAIITEIDTEKGTFGAARLVTEINDIPIDGESANANGVIADSFIPAATTASGERGGEVEALRKRVDGVVEWINKVDKSIKPIKEPATETGQDDKS